jgi:hypothetical protein
MRLNLGFVMEEDSALAFDAPFTDPTVCSQNAAFEEPRGRDPASIIQGATQSKVVAIPK